MESGVSYRPCVGRAPTPTDGAPTQLRIASFIRVLSWMAELHICPRLGRKALKHRADEGRNPKLSLKPQLSSLTNFQMTDRCEYLQLQFDQVKTRLEVNSLDWSQHLIDDIARLALCTVAVAIRVGKKRIISSQSQGLLKIPAHIITSQLSSTSASLQQDQLQLARSTPGILEEKCPPPPPTSLFSIILLIKCSHLDVASRELPIGGDGIDTEQERSFYWCDGSERAWRGHRIGGSG